MSVLSTVRLLLSISAMLSSVAVFCASPSVMSLLCVSWGRWVVDSSRVQASDTWADFVSVIAFVEDSAESVFVSEYSCFDMPGIHSVLSWTCFKSYGAISGSSFPVSSVSTLSVSWTSWFNCPSALSCITSLVVGMESMLFMSVSLELWISVTLSFNSLFAFSSVL